VEYTAILLHIYGDIAMLVRMNTDCSPETEKPDQSMISTYFNKVQAGDVQGLLELFSVDSVIYEPFSKSRCVVGKLEIESFLKIVTMISKGQQYGIKVERVERHKNISNIVTLVTFHKGDHIRGRFTFIIEDINELHTIKIKTLRIEILN